MQFILTCVSLVLYLVVFPAGFSAQAQGGVPVSRIPLPANAVGPDSLAFDAQGNGPYTGVGDGRILFYNRSTASFTEFAVTAPNRPRLLCDGNPLLPSICGRPLGLEFEQKTGNLYAADTSLGLTVVGPSGGNATILANSAEGVRFRFLNGLAIDQDAQVVYFTDTSSVYSLSQFPLVLATKDKTGRLLSYDTRTKELKVLLRGLAGPDGVAVSQSGDSVIFDEIVTNTIQRFWISGPKANTTQLLAQVKGTPDNIKRTSTGDFWVATTDLTVLIGNRTVGLRFSEDGVLQQNVTFNTGAVAPLLSEVNEFNGRLYLGFNLLVQFVGNASVPM